MTEPQRLLRPGAAARRLGVTLNTLRRWSHDGKLQTFKTLGGHRRYLDFEVADLRARQSN